MSKASPAERAKAWEREEPAELRWAADEWEQLGAHGHAEYLRGWADYHERKRDQPPPYVPRPF